MSEDLIDQLKRHEGLRLKPYRCSAGKLTIGYGRNLDDVGIYEEEAEYILQNDTIRARHECDKNIPFFRKLSINRQDVLINMCFNLGINGLLKFKNTLELIEEGKYEEASEAMLQSQWAEQVGQRADELAEQMKEG